MLKPQMLIQIYWVVNSEGKQPPEI